MRCTRCDRPAVPQALGRTRDGRLAFGWCPACLAEEGCTPVESDWSPFGVARRKHRRRARAPRRPRPGDDRRRLVYFLVGGMAAWTLTLMVLGLASLLAPARGHVGPLSRGSGQGLIAAGLLMGATGLAIWAGTLDRWLALRSIQAASALVAFALLAYGILRHSPGRDPWVVGMAAVALSVSWAARRAGRSPGRGPGPSRPAPIRTEGHG